MKKTRTLMEALEFHIDNIKKPWPPGALIERSDQGRRLRLRPAPHEPPPRYGGSPSIYNRPENEDYDLIVMTRAQQEALPLHYVILDSHWDPDDCRLWIEVLELGENSPHRERGWVLEPEKHFKEPEREKKT